MTLKKRFKIYGLVEQITTNTVLGSNDHNIQLTELYYSGKNNEGAIPIQPFNTLEEAEAFIEGATITDINFVILPVYTNS